MDLKTLGLSWKAAGLLSLVVLCSCSTPQTRVEENTARKVESVVDAQKPIQITNETVIIDARPRFEYSVAHIPRSISLQWTDYTEPQPGQRGILQRDLFAITRRLARLGISPTSQVVVVGRGLAGKGEEGRVAWMLRYLGVENVRFAQLEALKARLTQGADESQIPAVPMWKPEPVESFNVTRAELLFVLNKRGVDQPVAFDPGKEPVIYRIIDVRSEREYLGREGIGAQRRIPNMDAINIPWKEFFDPTLRPKPSMSQRLRQIGVEPGHRVIVLDEDGVSSAAVTMALRSLGFEKAGNYAGGLTDLMSASASQ